MLERARNRVDISVVLGNIRLVSLDIELELTRPGQLNDTVSLLLLPSLLLLKHIFVAP